MSTDVFGDLREWKQVLEHLEYFKNYSGRTRACYRAHPEHQSPPGHQLLPTANQPHTGFSSIWTLC